MMVVVASLSSSHRGQVVQPVTAPRPEPDGGGGLMEEEEEEDEENDFEVVPFVGQSRCCCCCCWSTLHRRMASALWTTTEFFRSSSAIGSRAALHCTALCPFRTVWPTLPSMAGWLVGCWLDRVPYSVRQVH